MDGILNVLKPPEMTSFDIVAHLRGLLGTRKIGHAGTLDPLAVGVLPVCAGKATKAIEFLMDKDKHYRAELTLGISTDTQDSSGVILSEKAPLCTDDEIIVSVCSFIGIYNQLPPMYSALKVDGKRLYELARDGVEVERQPRKIEIYSAEVLDIDRSAGVKVLIDVHCSKGTYIRTLCADIGERLGCGGHMSFLLRNRAGPFELNDAFTLEELAEKRNNGTLKDALQGVDKVFEGLSRCKLDENSEKKFRNGVRIPVPEELHHDRCGDRGSLRKETEKGEVSCLVRVYGADDSFLAIGEIISDETGAILKVRKFF